MDIQHFQKIVCLQTLETLNIMPNDCACAMHQAIIKHNTVRRLPHSLKLSLLSAQAAVFCGPARQAHQQLYFHQ